MILACQAKHTYYVQNRITDVLQASALHFSRTRESSSKIYSRGYPVFCLEFDRRDNRRRKYRKLMKRKKRPKNDKQKQRTESTSVNQKIPILLQMF
jgi:hypothetical protein